MVKTFLLSHKDKEHVWYMKISKISKIYEYFHIANLTDRPIT